MLVFVVDDFRTRVAIGTLLSWEKWSKKPRAPSRIEPGNLWLQGGDTCRFAMEFDPEVVNIPKSNILSMLFTIDPFGTQWQEADLFA